MAGTATNNSSTRGFGPVAARGPGPQFKTKLCQPPEPLCWEGGLRVLPHTAKPWPGAARLAVRPRRQGALGRIGRRGAWRGWRQ